jgi:plastocyanin
MSKWRFLLYGLVALAAMGCGFSTPPPTRAELPTVLPVPPDTLIMDIDITDLSHSDFEIEVGTAITWNNKTISHHTITHIPTEIGEQVAFDSDRLAPDGTFRVIFDKPGTFKYTCSLHPATSNATIVVKERSGP